MSLGTGVYRWPLEVAAKIAVAELNKSAFDKTMMCVADEMARAIYNNAFRESL